MKTIVCLLAAALLCGCQKQDHLDAVPAQTSVPITGAFGWVLGEKVPAQFDLFEGYGWADDNNHTNQPFSNIQGSCCYDRTVYEINGTAGRSQAEVIMAALETKYGRGGFGYTTNYDQFEKWCHGDCQLEVHTFKEIVTVTYKNMALQARHSEERQTRDNAASSNLSSHL